MLSDNFFKIAVIFTLTILKLLAGLLPVLFASTFRKLEPHRINIYASLCLCIGGGVLLASCMLHMLPEVREGVDTALPNASFPVAEFLVCCGFFTVYIFEEVIHTFTHQVPRSKEAEFRLNGKVVPKRDETSSLDKQNQNSLGVDLLVLFTMVLHTSLEGFTLGLQTTSESLWLLFAAILLHSAVVHLSFGLKLMAERKSEVQIVIFMCCLALGTLLGGVLGLTAIFNDDDSIGLYVVVLKGLTAGSLLYVTFFEVLINEKRKKGILRLFCVLLGFIVITIVQLVAGQHCHRCQTAESNDKNKTHNSGRK